MAASKRSSNCSVRSDGSFMGYSKVDEDVEHYVIPQAIPTEEKYKPPVIGRNQKEYKMDHMHRGKVIIFNHEKYEKSLELHDRKGTTVDKNNIKLTFEKFNFDVEIKDDLTETKIKEKLREESKNDRYNQCADCIVIVVLTHGEDQGYLYASDSKYHVDALWDNFTAVSCPALAMKPKIFIIQACRGNIPSQSYDPQKVQRDSKPTEASENRPYTIPAEADILVAYSTYEGRVAYRDIHDGTWFIEELCTELNRNGQKEDFLSLLTNVNRRVAVGKEEGCFKQMPVIQSTLTRKLFFKYYTEDIQENISVKMFEETNKKLDYVIDILNTNQDSEEKRPHRKEMAIIQWNDLKANIKAPTILLPQDINIYRLGLGLQRFLEEVPQPQDVQRDGETLLHLVSVWENLDKVAQCFVYSRIGSFLVKYAKEWKNFLLLSIPEEMISTEHRRRGSHTSVDSGGVSVMKGTGAQTLPRYKKKPTAWK